jgi:predicted DCC family thiol-disulfide oxidoreductase YuxK
LLYDGDCGFCTMSAAWVSRRWTGPDPPRAIAWQLLSEETLVRLGLTDVDVARSAWWIEGRHLEEGSRAIARALVATHGPWVIAGRMLLLPPIAWVAPLGYRLVARFRHRLPGGTPDCRV